MGTLRSRIGDLTGVEYPIEMYATGLHFDVLLVFFVYGLAFVLMGLAIALESGRTPALAGKGLLHPLAAFGVLHGAHEWLELFLMQIVWFGETYPTWTGWFRVVLLTASFIALTIYGIEAFRLPRHRLEANSIVYLGILFIYLIAILIAVVLTGRPEGQLDFGFYDTLVRYFMAVPGAALAGWGLRAQSLQARDQGRILLSRYLNWAALAFLIYGFTQFFVSPSLMVPARWVNAEAFLALTKVPIQLVRAAMALVVMSAVLRSIQQVEEERKHQLLAAQQARLEALEQIQDELTRRESMRRELLRHIVQAQEDERARIARELHDETAQVLSAFTLELATLRNSLRRRSELTQLVDRLQDLSRRMSQGLYHLVHDLRPAQLDDLGLIPAIKYILEQDCCPKGMQVDFTVAGSVRRFDPLVETVLFRVAQEALTNVVRHSGTNQARVEIHFESGGICLRVADAGAGFDPTAVFHPPHGWGIAGMRERVESVGGKLQIESAPGDGTLVEACIPVSEVVLGEMEGNDGTDQVNAG